MSASVVVELQCDALDRTVPVTDLLRKALVVARKLKIQELELWINKELSGYRETEDTPDYRSIRGQVKGWNPYHGWQPIVFGDAEIENLLSETKNPQAISEIENLINNKKDGSGTLQMPFPGHVQEQICHAIGHSTEITLIIQPPALVRIVDAVRTIVLNWALNLEENGILGEGLTFTVFEKEEVGKHPYNINNFYGSVHSSQIAQGSSHSTHTMNIVGSQKDEIADFICQLKEVVSDIKASGEAKAEVSAEIATIEAQMSSPKPKEGIIREGLKSIRSILEGAGGEIVAPLLVQLGKILLGS